MTTDNDNLIKVHEPVIEEFTQDFYFPTVTIGNVNVTPNSNIQDLLDSGFHIITVPSGLGDHFAFLRSLPKIMRKYPKLVLGCSGLFSNLFLSVFEDIDIAPDCKLVLIPLIMQPDEYDNIYNWMAANGWSHSLVTAYKKKHNVLNIVIAPFARTLEGVNNNPKNYPHWDKVIATIGEEHFTQILGDKKSEIPLVTDCRENLSFKEIKELIIDCDTWVSVDTFLPHLVNHIKKPGVVVWGISDPNIFGYPYNTNLISDRKNIIGFSNYKDVPYKPEVFVSPDTVVEAIYKMLDKTC